MSHIDAFAPAVDPPGWPRGFRAYSGRAGIKNAGQSGHGAAGASQGAGGDDLSFVVSERPARSAAMFTRSRFAGPAVLLSRQHAAGRRARAVVTLAQNANVATGAVGERNAAEVVRRVARIAGVPAEEVLIGSTGVIGRPLPMAAIRARLDAVAAAGAGALTAAPLAVARAMMTTDTRPKTAVRTVGGARLVGVAKGVGMLEPDMATMLAYVMTDAELSAGEPDAALRGAVDASFHRLSVDTDTSTSDSVVLIANGAAGPVAPAAFAAALREVCLELTLQLARDGEGATKLLRVTANAAADQEQAVRVAKSVVNSPLVKTAVHGADPNWGRVLMAVGKNTDDLRIDPARVSVRFGQVEVHPAEPGPATLARLTELMRGDEVDITVSLGLGDAHATVYGCDLTADYVRINADYTT